MRAMILAAGRGERMRGAFGGLHKGLLPLGGKPIITGLVGRLAAAGFAPLVINVSHQAQAVTEAAGDGAAHGIRISYSREKEPLETAGGIACALPLLGDEPFLAINADVHSEADLPRFRAEAERAMRAHGTLAHLMLVPNPAHNPAGDFSVRDGLALRGGKPRDATYSGIGVFDPRAFAGVPPGAKVPLIDVLEPLCAGARASAEVSHAFWCDAGTPERYRALVLHQGGPDPGVPASRAGKAAKP